MNVAVLGASPKPERYSHQAVVRLQNKGAVQVNTKRIVVIGGSAAGPKTAAKARRMGQHAKITILQRDPDLSMEVSTHDFP